MANQPPVRPWFRLTALRPLSTPAPAPAPAPAPEPRPPLALPTFRATSAPSSPPVRPGQPSEPTQPPAPKSSPPPPAPAERSSAPSSPAQKASATSPTSPVRKETVLTISSSASSSPSPKAAQPQPSNTPSPSKNNTTNAGAPSPNQSPKTIKTAVQTPMQSPKVKPTASPPSPLTLPPSQLRTNSKTEPKIPVEAEPKTVLVQETIEKPKQRLSGNHGKHVKSNEIETKEKGVHRKDRKHSDSEDSGMTVITIAGENRGAFMEVIQSPNKHKYGDKPNYLHKNDNSKVKVEGYESGKSSGDEGNVNKKDNKNHKGRTPASSPMTAFLNSNVQCINNSLMFNSSCTHHDPGVRLSLSKKPFGNGFHRKEHVSDGQHN